MKDIVHKEYDDEDGNTFCIIFKANKKTFGCERGGVITLNKQKKTNLSLLNGSCA